MGKVMELLKKSTVDTLFKDKIKGNKIGYYYNLIGISILPMWIVMWAWIGLEFLIEGKITDSLVDNIVALLCLIASYIILLIGMFIGRELGKKEQSYQLMLKIVEQLEEESLKKESK